MNFCSQCGASLSSNARFCSSCGAAVSQQPLQASNITAQPESATFTTSTSQFASSQYELERLNALNKSYTGPAVLVFALYWLFYVPGLVANILFYREAKRTEYIAGKRLPGTGFLLAMLWMNVFAFALIALVSVASMASGIAPFIYTLF